MDGPELVKFTLDVVPPMVAEILGAQRLEPRRRGDVPGAPGDGVHARRICASG